MKLKRGVDQTGVRHYTWFAIGFVDALCRSLGLGEITVTSLREGLHSPSSLHPKGLAVDIRTRNLSEPQKQDLYQRVRAQLDPLGFDTVLEGSHLHIEYDPKEGETFDARTD